MDGALDGIEFELVRLENGLSDVKCTRNGAELYIHGGVNPVEEAKKRTKEIVLKGNGLIVSFGFGLGYEAREIIKKMDAGTNFVIVEPSERVYEAVSGSADISDIAAAPNVHFYRFSEKGDALSYFRGFINRSNYKNLSAFVVAPYVELYFERCRELFFVIDDIRASFEMTGAAIGRFTSIWQKNALLNVKHNLNSRLVSDFFGSFLNVPAVIVSAGPSLLKNVGRLAGTEDSCLIICVDTALKPLLENGVKPHFIVSMDGQDIVARKFAGLDYGRFPLIYIPASSCAVLDGHDGPKLLSVAQDDFYRTALTELGRNPGFVEMGGSVATSAFSFAQLAGCNPVVLIGQDLAFTDMKSHYDGAAFFKEVDAGKRPDIISVPALNGGTVYTDRVFMTYITWFQTYAASDRTGRVYINATEGGAALSGFKRATLDDVIREYMNKTGVLKLVADAFASAPPLSSAEKRAIRGKYKSAASFIDDIKAPAKAAAAQLERIYALLLKSEPNYKAINSVYSQVSSFESRIKGGSELLSVLGIALAPFAERLNAEFENADIKDEREKNKLAALSYSKYYRHISELCYQFIDYLRRV